MATVRYFPGCCGVGTISGISGAQYGLEGVIDVIKSVIRSKLTVTFYTFAEAQKGATTKGYGGLIREYIVKNNLGRVTASPGWHMNVYHGPLKLKVYTWRVNVEGLAEWGKIHIPAAPVFKKGYTGGAEYHG